MHDQFKQLYQVLLQLQVNKNRLFDIKTLQVLMCSGSSLEREQDRSFMLADHYPITMDSLGPVSFAMIQK